MIRATLRFLLSLSAKIRLVLALPILLIVWTFNADKIGLVILKTAIYPYETIEAALDGRRLGK